MLDEITWTDLALSMATCAVVVAVPIAAMIGLLPRTNMRMRLICVWASLPISIWLGVLLTQPIGVSMFLGVMLAIALPSRAGLSALSYNLILRLRDFSGGEKYGDGN